MRDLMNMTFQVYRKMRVPDSIGGFTETETNTHSVVGFLSVRNIMTKERSQADQLEAEVTHDFFCMPDQDVKRNDVLEMDGHRYRIVNVRPAYDSISGTIHHLECEVSEVQEA